MLALLRLTRASKAENAARSGWEGKSRRQRTPQNILSDEWWYPTTLTRYGLRLPPSVCRTVTKSQRNDGWVLAWTPRASQARQRKNQPPLFSYACPFPGVEVEKFSARSRARKTGKQIGWRTCMKLGIIRRRLTVRSIELSTTTMILFHVSCDHYVRDKNERK